MKTSKTNLLLALSLCVVFASSCKKEDKEAPVITINGSDNISVGINTAYYELGASAVDAEDGALVPLITGLVNTNIAKSYRLIYSVSDKSGNSATAYRFVVVKNQSDFLAGNFQAHKIGFDTLTGIASDSSDYTQIVGLSTTVNNRITFTKFGNNTFAPSTTKINADLSNDKTQLIIPPQNANIVSVKHYYRGSGSVSGDSLMNIVYFDSLPNLKAKKYTLRLRK